MLEGDNRTTIMAGQCRYFEQHAWKREICTNCFKTREEHLGGSDTSRPSVAKASANLKTDAQKLQSILRANANCQAPRRKNVAFQESLTEVIGYGGNDFSDSEDNTETDDASSFELSESGNLPEEDIPDSEEDRALGNLTRANTNFNTVTANLTDAGSSEAKAAKCFASLMLGKVQKDSDGKKKTLLVSVTPFGADDTLPTAKRPSDKKVPSSSVSSAKTKQQDEPLGASSSKQDVEKVETPALMKNLMKSSHKSSIIDSKPDNENSGLEKIVDMPLITSSNLISVIQKSDALAATAELPIQKASTEKRVTSIARCPAIKKPDSEKPKIILQTSSYTAKSDYTVTRISKVTGLENSSLEPLDSRAFDSGVDLNENLGKSEEKMERGSSNLQGKDINKIEVPAAVLRSSNVDNLEERTVEGEAGPEPILLANRPFSYEESREKAGEPDGKADEEEMSEPPALPRTSPPTDSNSCRNMQSTVQRSTVIGSEPRTSFLHGEIKMKPALPQKPISLPSKPGTTTKNAISGSSMLKNQNGGYVIVPPLVKSASNQMQNSGRHGINDKSFSNDPGTRMIPNYSILQTSSSLKIDQLKTFQAPKESKLKESFVENSSNSSDDFHAAMIFKANGQSGVESRINGTVKQKGPLSVAEETESPKLERTSTNGYEDELASGEPDMRGDITADSTAELIRSPNKRRMAPKPPATMADELPASIFARNPAAANLKSDSPVVREKEKRERASSCSPKFRKAISEAPDPCGSSNAPEAAPRRTISLSQGSLANVDKTEEKKKSRPRFSLKRLLRMGTRKDVDMTCGNGGGSNSRTDEIPTTPQPKPRLEIIHPLELDGAAVEVLRHDRIVQSGEDVPDSKSENAPQSPGNHHHVAATRPGKPPPPPRNVQSPDDYLRLTETSNKPIRPPPPRNEAKIPARSEKPIFSKTWQPSSSPSTTDSIYANLGKFRPIQCN